MFIGETKTPYLLDWFHRLLRTPNSDKYRAHSGGIQLRYSFDGVNPTRAFADPREFIVRKGKAL